ncbi:HPP family protein [mine drainage metagenome]|uniref:HPP family protein n=1 Tax=mine drainage metagenome TaxID=410659 RepID=A0A1J5QM45_9ZZZZ
MKPIFLVKTFLAGYQSSHTPIREKVYSSLGSFVAILILVASVHHFSVDISFSLPVLASMGASTFLLFVVPHSPMAQPWPTIGGHILSAVIGVACALWIHDLVLATASAVAISIFAMHWMHCLHPPSAATAMIAVLGGPEVHVLGWRFCYEVVAVNAGVILLLAFAINNLIPGRRYPLSHTHHPHHAQFGKSDHRPYAELKDEDFHWALSKMDGFIDVSAEDLIDLYEFAVEHAQHQNSNLEPLKS